MLLPVGLQGERLYCVRVFTDDVDSYVGLIFQGTGNK